MPCCYIHIQAPGHAVTGRCLVPAAMSVRWGRQRKRRAFIVASRSLVTMRSYAVLFTMGVSVFTPRLYACASRPFLAAICHDLIHLFEALFIRSPLSTRPRTRTAMFDAVWSVASFLIDSTQSFRSFTFTGPPIAPSRVSFHGHVCIRLLRGRTCNSIITTAKQRNNTKNTTLLQSGATRARKKLKDS